ncbi:MAG: pilin [Patescibacteria group bacterium]|jgi:TRAP-type C4-dicarboxylate transport system permease small subunit
MQKLVYYIVIIFCFSFFIFSFNIFSLSASSFNDGLKNTGGAMGYDTGEVNFTTDLTNRIGKIISVANSFLGVIFLLLMIYAGFLWMTARGNEQQLEKAKNIIIYSIIGLAVVLAAYAITQLISILWRKS